MDIMNLFNEFHGTGVLSKAITSSFLTLIPKTPNTMCLDDFRPIFLVGSIYKVISKLLAARLKKVLHCLVSPCQSAFVPRRQMIDEVLIANEIVDIASKEGSWECLLFKVDFEKAYDKPDEGLQSRERKAKEMGEFSSFIVKDSCAMDILQFADDTLMLGNGGWKYVWDLKTVLRGFEIISDLGVNFHKSKLIGLNLNPHFLLAAANFLACKVETNPFSFLEIQIGINPGRASSWIPLIDKLKLSFFKASVSVCKEIVKIQSSFLWGETTEEKDTLGNPLSRNCSIWWKDLLNLDKRDHDRILLDNCSILLGDGKSALFWIDDWNQVGILRDIYPDLYAISSDKKETVASWIRRMNERERGGFGSPESVHFSVADRMQNLRLILGRIEFSNGLDDVKNQGHEGSSSREEILFKNLWKTSVPFQIKAFGWRLLHDRLATKNNLLIRGIIHSLSNLFCPFCLESEESLYHLLSSCHVSREVWSRVASWAGFVNTNKDTIGQHFLVWVEFFKKKKVRSGNEGIVWIAVWWSLWRARIGMIFNDAINFVSDIIWDIKVLAWK
ncbi:uncharacterized protein LOC131628815 [Vicia villosa]|uniref:uncharacterized protein LOC131628815 n=1 Tax=Vicia villosa TaxID=3911 RepID=UPI00273BF9E9|nr:uncharacterized protein LOC131628815 [Vicia villosa]